MFTKLHNLRYASMAAVLIALLIFSGCSDKQSGKQAETGEAAAPKKKEWLSILGGVMGGSFSQFAGGITRVLADKEPHLKISVNASAGSVENTRRVNDDPESLGVVFASESYLGYYGREIFEAEGPRTNIRVVTLLFIAYDQFSTLADSDIYQFEDIVGKKIAAGASGSGTAQTLERLSRLAGLWGEFTPVYKGGSAAAEALQDGQVQGFQWLVSVPNSAVIQLTAIKSIRMLDLDAAAKKYGFYEKYPFYLSGRLPAGAYEGKVEPVNTILMPTILIANKAVSEETIYKLLKHLYSPEGHQAMLQTNQAAADMTIANGPKAFVIPLHRGAYKFWKEQGVDIPADALPVDE